MNRDPQNRRIDESDGTVPPPMGDAVHPLESTSGKPPAASAGQASGVARYDASHSPAAAPTKSETRRLAHESVTGRSSAPPTKPPKDDDAETRTDKADTHLYNQRVQTTLSVVMPVYNERNTLGEILRRVRDTPIDKEIILVDDYSTDGTREMLADMQAESDLRILFHPHNRGKGAALCTGFEHARGQVVLIQDADLEYDPREYGQLVQPILDDRADVVYGSRFMGDGTHRVVSYWHYLGNRFLTTCSNMFTDLHLTDMETCYKAFRRDVIQKIVPTLKQQRFGIEPELTAKIARGRYRVYETPISYAGRPYSEGKKIGWRDGVNALWCIVRFWRWD
jgi:hypothetical protein